ncbi:MAG: hypothetical protein AAF709_14630 [Pseudomonadota bacterium]
MTKVERRQCGKHAGPDAQTGFQFSETVSSGWRIRLEVTDVTRGLVGKHFDVNEMPDERIQVRAKRIALPCSIFDPHQQRVTHATITENKHLSAVLAHIKEEREKAAPPPKVKPVSAKNGYKKTGRRPPGRRSKMEAYYERRRAERAAAAQDQD